MRTNHSPSCICVFILRLPRSSAFVQPVLIFSVRRCFFAVRELLSFYKFPGDTIEIVRGSALAAATDGDATLGKEAILQLMEAVERSIPIPKRELEKPFLMPVEDTFSIAGRGTVATGRVEQGCIKVGEDIEIVGIVPTQKTICTGESDFPGDCGHCCACL